MEEAFDLAREGRLAVTADLIDCGLQGLRRHPSHHLGESTEEECRPGRGGGNRRLHPPAAGAEGSAGGRTESRPQALPRLARHLRLSSNRTARCSIPARIRLRCSTTCGNWDRRTSRLMRTRCRRWLRSRRSTAISGGRSCWSPTAIRLPSQDVFVFVEDECDVRIRLLEDQAAAVALLGSVPADAFELFVAGVRRASGGIERDALALEERSERRGTTSTLSFEEFTASRAMPVCCWDTSRAPPSPTVIHCNCCSGWPTALESLLDPFRGASAGPVSDETIQTALETCDAIRTLLGSLTPQRRGRTGLAGTARASGSRGPTAAPGSPARGRAGSRVSEHDVAVRGDDRGLFRSAWRMTSEAADPSWRPICAASEPCRLPRSTRTAGIGRTGGATAPDPGCRGEDRRRH